MPPEFEEDKFDDEDIPGQTVSEKETQRLKK
jgi:hypothetical protein